MNFEQWWYAYGSGILPLKNHDMEEHGRRIAGIAFNVCQSVQRINNNPNLVTCGCEDSYPINSDAAKFILKNGECENCVASRFVS